MIVRKENILAMTEKKRIPMRDGYGNALLKLCEKNPKIMVLDADVAKSTRTVWIKEKYPEHFLDMGISEQDMIGTASGMALAGQIPFCSTYGVFLAGRAWDQIRTTVCYNQLNVKLGGAHAGLSVGKDGATHQALEDVAIMRVLPHMTVVVPCDAVETEKATLAAAAWQGPVYVRFGREAVDVITDDDTPFEIGKARLAYGIDVNEYAMSDRLPESSTASSDHSSVRADVASDSEKSLDCVIFANGPMVGEAVKAAEVLTQEGLKITVYDNHTVKPLDTTTILAAARNTRCILTAEEHQKAGGMGSTVAEFLAEHCPVPMRIIGVNDSFGQSGTPEELYRYYGLTAGHLVKAAHELLDKR